MLPRSASAARAGAAARTMPFPIAPPIEPMLAKLADELPAGPFLYEPKWDGFRAIVFRGGGDVYIQSRDLRPLDRYFPELHAALLAALGVVGIGFALVSFLIVLISGSGLPADWLRSDFAWIGLNLVAGLGLLIAAAVMYLRLPTGFLPNEDQGSVMVQYTLPAGATTAMVSPRFWPNERRKELSGSTTSPSCDRPKALPFRRSEPTTVQRAVGPTLMRSPFSRRISPGI